MLTGHFPKFCGFYIFPLPSDDKYPRQNGCHQNFNVFFPLTYKLEMMIFPVDIPLGDWGKGYICHHHHHRNHNQPQPIMECLWLWPSGYNMKSHLENGHPTLPTFPSLFPLLLKSLGNYSILSVLANSHFVGGTMLH